MPPGPAWPACCFAWPASPGTQGIIHRDIKPANIGVQPDFTVKLFDWGEALQLDQLHDLTDKQLAKVAGVAGTPLFMPPESLLYLTGRDNSTATSSNHCRGEGAGGSSSRSSASHAPTGCSCWGGYGGHLGLPQQHAGALRALTSPKLDIWGLGTVVYLLLAGRDILQDDSSYDLQDMAEVVSASTGIKLPAKARASAAARDFLAHALERDPAKRASAGELLEHPWLAGLVTASDQRSRLLGQHKDALASRAPQLLALPQSRSSEGLDTIAAHRSCTSSSVPETPVSGATEVLSEISEYDE